MMIFPQIKDENAKWSIMLTIEDTPTKLTHYNNLYFSLLEKFLFVLYSSQST